VALIETDLLSALQSAGERADKLSQFATYFGDAALVNTQLSQYRDVTADQVNNFVQEFLGDDNRIALVYVPRTTAAA
jgi:zinc protease